MGEASLEPRQERVLRRREWEANHDESAKRSRLRAKVAQRYWGIWGQLF